MKIATWNVNGIRARQAQLLEWIERERPDVVCLQEIKASADQIPAAALRARGLLVLLARRARATPASALHVSKAFAPSARRSRTRPSTTRTGSSRPSCRGVTVASVYVPNGGKDFPAKMRFLEAMDALRAQALAASGPPLVICGDLNIARTDIDVHPKERKPRSDRPAAGRARAARAHHRAAASSTSAARSIPDNDGLFTWWAPWRNMRAAQHRLAPRLRARAARRSPREPRRAPSRSEIGTSDHAPVVATFS